MFTRRTASRRRYESPTNRTEDGEATSTHRGFCDRVDSFRFVSYALRAAQLHEKRSRLKRIFNDLRTFFDPARYPGANHCVVLAIGIVSTPGKKPPTPIESQNNAHHHS